MLKRSSFEDNQSTYYTSIASNLPRAVDEASAVGNTTIWSTWLCIFMPFYLTLPLVILGCGRG